MNRWKFHRNTSRLILALASLLTLIIIVITGAIGYAVTPEAAIIAEIKGTGLVIGDGTNHDRKRASEGQQLEEPNQILYVPGGNKSLAYLGFIAAAPLDSLGLLVSAGPSSTPSEWSFPCKGTGGFKIAWTEGSDRGCEEGIKVQSSSKRGWLPNNNLQVSRRLLAQAEDEVTVVPTQGQSIIQTADSAAGISIDVLVGDVQVKSAKNPEGRPVKAGERYNYPQDTVTPFDPTPIVNSPEMQEFLNPNNWSSPDIPQRVADGFSEQLGEMRTALGQGSPAIASNSGNNNNSGQSPTASGSRPEHKGDFVLEMGLFRLSSSSSCEAVPGTTNKYPITMTDNNGQLTINAPPIVPMTTGNTSRIGIGDDNLYQFEASGPSPIRWSGTFRGDGNSMDITGTATCGTASQPFKIEGLWRPLGMKNQ